jgi:hypothetical protein
MATANVSALDRIARGLDRWIEPDLTPLMEKWERRLFDGNKRGVLAQTDKDGVRVADVTYRPKTAPGRRWTGKDQKQHKATAHERFKAPLAAGHDENLTSAQYRQLNGPRLAPRRLNSRIITHLYTGHGYREGRRVWYAEARWFDVVSNKGVQFLIYHFEGTGQVKYDLRGIRPADRQGFIDDLNEWGRQYLRVSFG